MRGVLVLLVSVGIAGCLEQGSPPTIEPAPDAGTPASESDAPVSPALDPSTPTLPSPAAVVTATPPSAPPASSAPVATTPRTTTSTPPPPTQPEPPAPYRAYSTGAGGHDYANDEPGTTTFKIAGGYSSVALRVTFMPGAPAPLLLATTSTVTLVSPTGDIAECAPSAPIVPGAGESCAKTVSAKAGTWGVRYDGVGAVVATVVVDVS